MIHIQEDTVSQAWRKAVTQLRDTPTHTTEEKYFKDTPATITIERPLENRYDSDFPMSHEKIKAYRQFILTGKSSKLVEQEHALYHTRIFDYENNNQVHYVINKLRENPLSKRAIISLWAPNIDQTKDKVPCMTLLWFRIINQKLNVHAHMRANDAYGKLLMNLNLTTELQKHIAAALKVEPGTYHHLVSSLHLYTRDEKKIRLL